MQPAPKGENGNDGAKKDGWTIVEENQKQNDLFEEYYKVGRQYARHSAFADAQAQGILSEQEFPIMLESLQKELPTTFRVTGSRA
jgi:hypothetical protein